MAENPFNNPTFNMMYKDALWSLYAGNVMPFERDILAMAPLPTDVVDPFASQDVDPRQIMGFAYNSLVTWIDEAKKTNYFSKRFTDFSKLVMKGVMTMGRGLVTLNNRGEDLSQAPLQIGDLISVSSYHFRKSYLGVIQTAKSHPEISERLLMNQLSWTNLLLRLYKTKDKLASVASRQQSVGNAECGIRNEESLPNSEGGMRNAELASDKDQSSLNHGHALSDVAALFEPAAIGAPRALSSLDGSKSPSVSRRHAIGSSDTGYQTKLSGKSSAEDGSQKAVFEGSKAETKTSGQIEYTKDRPEKSEISSPERETANSQSEEKLSETETRRAPENPETKTKKAEESGPERETRDDPKTPNGQSEEIGNEKERAEHEKTSDDFPGPDLSPGDSDVETGTDPGVGEKLHEILTDYSEQTGPKKEPSGKPGNTQIAKHEKTPGSCPEPDPLPGDSDEGTENLPCRCEQIHASGQPANDPAEYCSMGVNEPFYLEVLRHAFARSVANEDGRVTFTSDEICYLAHDPDFAGIYPDQAADMRRILVQLVREERFPPP